MPGFEEITRHRDPDPTEDPWVTGRLRPRRSPSPPYNPEWPRRYQALSTEIRTALRDVALDVEHVGSTSVEGLAAKDVIDIDLTVADPRMSTRMSPRSKTSAMSSPFESRPSMSTDASRSPSPDVNLHAFGPDCPEVIRQRMFRDWLRARPEDRALYEDAKQAAVPGGGNIMDYNARKQHIIR
jgi:GrpB-like predicted nucleotidyltransferase (UPF0157 family)